jgi:N-hydroxyarylamine O-acetyltransferase
VVATTRSQGMTQAPDGMSDDTSPAIDLDAYRTRVGYTGPLEPTLDVLRALHFAHATNIPFENLDILLGRPISLELGHLQDKLVRARRGGYCFEHNTLFAAVLERVGFRVERYAARVRMGATGVRPRTHMLLGVFVDCEPWLADVGFGNGGPLYPTPLAASELDTQELWSYRIAAEGETSVLQTLQADGWLDLYAFSREVQEPVDYVIANHFTSTHPQSHFVQMLIAQRSAPGKRWTLKNRELTLARPEESTTITLPENDDAIVNTLATVFDLHFPPGTRFRYRTMPSS